MLKKLVNLSTRLFIRLFPPEKPILFTGAGSTIKMASLVRKSGYKHPLLITGTTLSEQIGIPREILDVESKDHDAITNNALKEARWSYPVPRRMNRAECNEILMSITQA